LWFIHPIPTALSLEQLFLVQGVQRAHDYVLIFVGEVPPVVINFLGTSSLQCGPTVRLHDYVCQHKILFLCLNELDFAPNSFLLDDILVLRRDVSLVLWGMLLGINIPKVDITHPNTPLL
jgi:hypothetical protein